MSDVLLTRIAAAAQRIQDHQDAISAEKKRRDQLIREALTPGSGLSYGMVAKAARRSKSRCATIAGEDD